MNLSYVDFIAFGTFLAVVVGVSPYAGRREGTTEDYFLAGRSLTWWLIGISLIASNISTEHFVGMAGSAYGQVGLAIASYEWMAAVTLVLVAWFLLPRFLRAGIYTMPEFLEYRYDARARAVMAFFLMLAYIVVALATVLYSGAIGLNAIFGLPELFAQRFGLDGEAAQSAAMVSSIWLIGIVAGAYTIYGGLKAVVWSDLIHGSVLMLGGLSRPRDRLRRLGWDRRDLGRYSCLFRSERAQAAHRVAMERPRNAVARGVRWRALDPEPLLLGHEPVHHPENAGCQESCRGAEGDPFCRLSQAPHSIYHRISGIHGVPALRE